MYVQKKNAFLKFLRGKLKAQKTQYQIVTPHRGLLTAVQISGKKIESPDLNDMIYDQLK